MHTNQTYNYLTIDNVEKVSFPARAKEYISKIDWEKQDWYSVGLPAFDSKFSVSDNLLYLEEDSDGNKKIEKIEFTGEILINTTLINPDNCGENFILSFNALFFKGLFCETTLREYKVQPYEEYEKGFNEYNKKIQDEINLRNSWHFKYLYTPIFYTIKGVLLAIIYPIEFVLKRLLSIVDKILPIDPK